VRGTCRHSREAEKVEDREAGKVEDREAGKVEELEELGQGFRVCN